MTRHVGVNGTFYIIQDNDSLVDKEVYVQVYIFIVGRFSSHHLYDIVMFIPIGSSSS